MKARTLRFQLTLLTSFRNQMVPNAHVHDRGRLPLPVRCSVGPLWEPDSEQSFDLLFDMDARRGPGFADVQLQPSETGFQF